MEPERPLKLRSIATAAMACALVVAACGPAPSLSRSPSASSSAPSASQTPAAATLTPSSGTTPGAPTATLPVQGSAREIGELIRTAAAPDGGVFVSIPHESGSILVLLDKSGNPRPGWPITVEGTTSCPGVLPASDGSVRLVCANVGRDDVDFLAPRTAFAFDANAVPLAGWPVELGCCYETHRVVGDTLVLLQLPEEGEPAAVVPVTVGRDGAMRGGQPRRIFQDCCQWAIGPDGVAYGTEKVSGLDRETPEISQLVIVGAEDDVGEVDGLAAAPAFATDGRVLVTVGSLVEPITRVHAFEAGSHLRLATSPELRTVTAGFGDVGGCGLENPTPPLVGGDGTIYVINWAAPLFALDPTLQPRTGWPYGGPLAVRDSRYVREDAFCPSPAIPAAAPDGTLFLPLDKGDAPESGGSILAFRPDGTEPDGWPVTLTRSGGEFWSVAAGPDGTVYALAVELESPTTSSATIVGIAPDSTVLFSTTIVDP
jgi:hypothetical protein